VREGVALFEPGAGYEYSNLGIALAGEVVAAAAGMPWEEYVERHVLAPLGMASTSAAGPRAPPERLATGYLTRPADGAPPVSPTVSPPLAPPTVSRALAPAAEMSSTVEDLARFVSAHLAGPGAAASALLSPATRREMHRVHWLSPSWTSGRGLGFSVWRQGDRTLVGHGGWVAGHRAQIAFDPESRVGVVVLTNSDQGGPASYVRQAFELVAPAIEKLTAPAAEVSATEDPERFAGTYSTPWGEVTDVLVLDGGLVLYDRSHPPADDVEGSLTRLIPEGGAAFRMATDDDTGSRVVFEIEGGRVVRVKVGENYLFPLGCGRLGPDLRCTWAGEER
jgi:CubicO group peptidase (beta-lactamase class C family)